ncbi:MAG TPA: F0F1 ATP synthase subunit gamma [Acetobacteraceae bacterium]|nr:F0F1 ATP synthase subunit gamma [Acetobacteraceae bacterium]
MAEELAAVRARIRGVRQLDAVIGAMRGIAAAHAQQSRGLLPGVRAYAEVVAQAIAEALRMHDSDARTGSAQHGKARVVFCAEQGFVGGFAEHMLADAAAREPADIFLLGSRGMLLAAAHGIAPVWQSTMATEPGGISGVCLRLADALYERMSSQPVHSVEVLFPIWSGSDGIRVTCQSLLPLDPARFACARNGMPPLATLPPEALLANLAEEYVFASLCEAAMQAFVAENEARAAAMVRARGKVQDMLDGLALTEHRVRQEAITAELVELAAATLA